MGETEKMVREKITAELIEILRDMTSDWDLDYSGGIGAETRLVKDLGFESIDIVQFVVAIEENFKRKGLPFEELLMTEGRYVDDITVGDTAAFLHRHINYY
jgi:acyl carrier protein